MKTFQQIHSKISWRYILAMLLVILGSSSFILSYNSYAETASCDQDFYNTNDILFYDKCATSTQTCSNSASISVFNNSNYAGNEIFSSAQLSTIEENKVFYEKAANKENIPWQLLASIHGKETGFKRTGPKNGYGPYQITPSNYPVKESYSDVEFQDASDKAAAFVKSKVGSKDLTDPNNIKYALFVYNGAAEVYKSQAKKLGFTDEEADRGEGSPYVMNMFDLKRDPTVEPTKSNGTWGQIKTDYGSISYPANNGAGAFVYYSALTNNALCGGTVSVDGDANSVQEAFTDYMNSHNNRYGAYYLGYNGCTTLSSWYIGEYTNLTYNGGNGKEVVANLVAKNKDKGLVQTDKPTAPAIFSVAGGVKTWGASGINPGHVGVVISVDEASQTATVVHTGSSKVGASEKAWVSKYKYPASGVTFTSLGGNLK